MPISVKNIWICLQSLSPKKKAALIFALSIGVALLLFVIAGRNIWDDYWAYFMLAIFSYLVLEKAYQTAARIILLLGILFTFMGISRALLNFDVQDIDGSVINLLSGLKTAFYSSVLGMILASFTRFVLETRAEKSLQNDPTNWSEEFSAGFGHVKSLRTNIDTLTERVQQIRHHLESSKNVLEQTRLVPGVSEPLPPLLELIHYQRSLHQTLEEINARDAQQSQTLQEYLAERNQEATEHMITAMTEIVEQLEAAIRQELGESFATFRDTISEMKDMLDAHQNQLLLDAQSRATAAEGIEHVTTVMQSMAPVLNNYSSTMETLQNTLTLSVEKQDASRIAIAELTDSAMIFKDSTDALVRANHQWLALAEQTDSMHEAINGFLATSEAAFNAHTEKLIISREEFRKALEAQTNLILEAHDQQLASLESVMSGAEDMHDRQMHTMEELMSAAELSYHNQQERMTSLREAADAAHDAHIQRFRNEVQSSLDVYATGLARQVEPILQSLSKASSSVERAAELPDTIMGKAEDIMDVLARETQAIIQDQLIRLQDEMKMLGTQSAIAMSEALARVTDKVAEDYSEFMEQLRKFNQLVKREIEETNRTRSRPRVEDSVELNQVSPTHIPTPPAFTENSNSQKAITTSKSPSPQPATPLSSRRGSFSGGPQKP